MRDREASAAIRDLAERQHGVVAHWQILGLDKSKALVYARRDGRLLSPVHQGVYALGHRRISRQGRWMTAALACGPGAVLSHFTAGQLWQMCGSRGSIEILRQSGGFTADSRHRGVWLHQTRRLHPWEIAIEQGIPVATRERILLDLAGRTDPKRLERILVQTYKSGKLDWQRLAWITTRRRGCKGVGRLRRIALEVNPEALETKAIRRSTSWRYGAR